MRQALAGSLDALRHEPTERRIRGGLGGEPVIDSTRAVLVWEPWRISPAYAVPIEDVAAEILAGDPVEVSAPAPSGPSVLHPGIPFAVHSTPGETVVVRAAGDTAGAGFRPADPDLAGLVVLDFASFDDWREEDEPIIGHPHNPYHRIEVLPSSRTVRVELDGHVLAESSRPALLFESNLPVRAYIPREDVEMTVLQPSELRTICAYKGVARYWSAQVGARVIDDVVWSYDEPRHEAAGVARLLAFFNERVEISLDGVAVGRPQTAWSRPD